MIHCVVLPPHPELPIHSRSWVRSEGFSKEAAAGKRLFDGTLVAPRGWPLLWALVCNGLRAGQAQKDTVNTGLLPLGADGRCLALMEQSLPAELRVYADGTVRTSTAGVDFDGGLRDLSRFPFSGGALTAHLKLDPASGERVGVTYPSSGSPSARVTTFGEDGTLSSDVYVPTESPVQTMIHDCAITPAFALLLDLPMTIRPARMIGDTFPVEYEPEIGGRIGLWPRGSAGNDDTSAQWFEVEPCVVLHTINAHESDDGQTVTLHALRSTPSGEASFIEAYSSAFLHRWVLDRTSGRCVREATLCDMPLEFPTLDSRLVGLDARFAYAIAPCSIGGPNVYGPPNEGILINAVVKLDLHTGQVVARWQTPRGYYLVSEPTFLPKEGSDAADGDQGYLLVWVSTAGATAESPQEASDGRAARLYVIDAASMTMHSDEGDAGEDALLSSGAVAALELPGAVPYGLHSCWVPYGDLARSRAD